MAPLSSYVWKVASQSPGLRQTQCQVLCSASPFMGWMVAKVDVRNEFKRHSLNLQSPASIRPHDTQLPSCDLGETVFKLNNSQLIIGSKVSPCTDVLAMSLHFFLFFPKRQTFIFDYVATASWLHCEWKSHTHSHTTPSSYFLYHLQWRVCLEAAETLCK